MGKPNARLTAEQRRLIADGFVSVAKAAAYLGISPQQTYNLIHGGVLSHSKHGGKIVVPWVSIKAYAAQRLKIGSIA